MTLTAQWGTKDKRQVTYKPGIGAIGSDHVVDEMLINQSFTLKNVGECGFTAKPNYEFKGWLNATDNKVYQPGVQLQVDDENQGTQNILTAQWAPILTVILVTSLGRMMAIATPINSTPWFMVTNNHRR